MGFPNEFDADFGTTDDRLKEMQKVSVYAGEPELMALVHVVRHPIQVFQPAAKYCYGDVFQKEVAPIYLKYSPEEASSQGMTPGHHDLLIDPLYPRTGGFVGIKFGRCIWYMSQVTNIDLSMPEIEVKFMVQSGSTFIFTDEQPSWIDLQKVLHVCDTPDIDHRLCYIFAKKDIDIIEAKLRRKVILVCKQIQTDDEI